MLRDICESATFCHCLVTIDLEIPEITKNQNCPHCGAKLDRADFPRKVNPKGIGDPSAFAMRLGLCCRAEGCRKRLLPQSVRFFGARQTVLPMFLLAALMIAPLSSKGVKILCHNFGVVPTTIRRWRTFIRKHLEQSASLVNLRAHFPGFGLQSRSFVQLWCRTRTCNESTCLTALAILCCFVEQEMVFGTFCAWFSCPAEFGC